MSDTEDQKQLNYEHWSEQNADAIAASDEFMADQRNAADSFDDAAELLYSGPETEQADAEPTAKDTSDNQHAQETARTEQVHQHLDENLPLAQQEFALRLADLSQRAREVDSLQSDDGKRIAAGSLEREAQDLGQVAQALRSAGMAQEQRRLHELRPGLKSKAQREQFVKWGMLKFGVTREQAAGITDVPTLLHYYDHWQGELREAQAEADAQREADAADLAEKQERDRVEGLSPAARIAELRGQPNAAVALYGTPKEQKAHFAAIRKVHKERPFV